MDLWKDIKFDIISHADLKKFYGKRTQNGWKLKPNDHLNIVNYGALLKLYEDVYAHPPNNG
jgi:hypothetical protein